MFTSTSPLKPLPTFDADAHAADVPDMTISTTTSTFLTLLAEWIYYLYHNYLHCVDMYRRHQADSSTTMPNALRGMYLLTTTLRGM
jgi:hypothetical protein